MTRFERFFEICMITLGALNATLVIWVIFSF
jgi:hypothetical protein